MLIRHPSPLGYRKQKNFRQYYNPKGPSDGRRCRAKSRAPRRCAPTRRCRYSDLPPWRFPCWILDICFFCRGRSSNNQQGISNIQGRSRCRATRSGGDEPEGSVLWAIGSKRISDNTTIQRAPQTGGAAAPKVGRPLRFGCLPGQTFYSPIVPRSAIARVLAMRPHQALPRQKSSGIHFAQRTGKGTSHSLSPNGIIWSPE